MKNFKLFGAILGDNVDTSRNEKFTDRAVNDLDPSQQVELGHYEEAAPITATSASGVTMQDVYKSANMEKYHLDNALDREYPLLNFDWTTTSAQSVQLAKIDFPASLFNKTFIANKIANFRLFRGAIRLSVRLTTNKFLYGKLMVIYEPALNMDATAGITGTVFMNSGSPHMLISASASETAVFDVPFVSQKRALDLSSYANDELGSFRIMVLNPLTNVNGGVGSCKVFVTAQFVDTELLLPHDDTFIPQSRRSVESVKKSSGSNISSALEDVAAISGSLSTVPFVAPYAGLVTTVASGASAAFKMAGLSKPTTLDLANVCKVSPFSDMNSGRGIDTSVKMAMDPENAISTVPVVGGMGTDEMTLLSVVCTPQLINTVNFLEGSSATEIMNAGPYDTNSCFVDFVSRNFKYFSGSYKVKVYITASLFHAVRGVFWLAVDELSTDWATCYHRVVDIQGDTEVEFVIPYCPAAVAQDSKSVDVYRLNFSVLTWSQPDPVISAPITLNVYKAADTDFQFGALLENAFTVQSNPRADFSKIFEPLHPDITGYTHDGLLYGEKYTTLREILHHYTPLTTKPATQMPAYGGTGNLGPGVYMGLEFWGLLFRFWRGSIRHKFVNKDPSVVMGAYTYVNSDAGLAHNLPNMVMTSTTNPLLEMDVPYYSNNLFESTTPTLSTNIRIAKSVASPYWFSAAGDDFSFHWLRAPPPGTLATVGSTYGVAGFLNYLTSV